MLNATVVVEGFLMIVLALALGLFLHHRMGAAWRLYVAGVLTFIASQVVHIPLLIGLTTLFTQKIVPQPPAEWMLPFNAVVLGLAAGLCEELARWVAYRFVIREARTWRDALMFGAGHGGIESILAGLAVLGIFIAFAVMSPEQIAALPVQAQAQAQAIHSAPDLLPLVGVLERIFAICIQLGMAVLVLQTFTRGSPLYLAAAILFHAVVDGIAVYAGPTWGVGVTEGLVGVMALLAVGIIFAFRPRANAAQPAGTML